MRVPGAIIMGDVAIIFKLMPESPEVDLEATRAEILSRIPETKDMQKEPIGFGLSALKVLVVVPDAEGNQERVEEILTGLEGIASVEIVSNTLT
jgi:elongation factor 1-beta